MVEKTDPEAIVREIKRRTRKKYSSEEKIRIVLEGLRREESIAELCRKEGIQPNVYYKWSKEFLGAGVKRLRGDTVREATSTRHQSANAKASFDKLWTDIVIDRERRVAKCYLLAMPRSAGKIVEEILQSATTPLQAVPPTRFELVLQA